MRHMMNEALYTAIIFGGKRMNYLINQIIGYNKIITRLESYDKRTDFENDRLKYCLKAREKLLKQLVKDKDLLEK